MQSKTNTHKRKRGREPEGRRGWAVGSGGDCAVGCWPLNRRRRRENPAARGMHVWRRVTVDGGSVLFSAVSVSHRKVGGGIHEAKRSEICRDDGTERETVSLFCRFSWGRNAHEGGMNDSHATLDLFLFLTFHTYKCSEPTNFN